MSIAAYHLFVIVVAVIGIVTGYRRGLLRQVSAILAIAFGVVCVRMFGNDVAGELANGICKHLTGFNVRFAVITLSATIVYTVVYAVVRLVTFPLGALMRLLPSGLINSLLGALLGAFKYLMFVSLAYNLIVDFSPRSELLKVSTSHDGNVVEGVIKIAPPVLGIPGANDVVHALQLEDAKKIS